MDHSNHDRRDWAGQLSHGRSVIAPPRHEGIGDALRRAYISPVSSRSELPQDMTALLAMLD